MSDQTTTMAILGRFAIAIKLGVDSSSIPKDFTFRTFTSLEMASSIIGLTEPRWDDMTITLSFFDDKNYRYGTISEWCREHLGDDYSDTVLWEQGVFSFSFKTEAAMVAFKLRFLS